MTEQTATQTAAEIKEQYPNLKVSKLREAKNIIEEAKVKNELKALPNTIKTDKLTEYTRDVLQSFGLEAPAVLNDWSCALEDALIEFHSVNKALTDEVNRCHQEIDGLNQLRISNQEDFTTVRELVEAENWSTLKDVARVLGHS